MVPLPLNDLYNISDHEQIMHRKLHNHIYNSRNIEQKFINAAFPNE